MSDADARRAMNALLSAAPEYLPDAEGRLAVGGRRLPPAQILETLAPHLTEARRARIDAVVARRTYGVMPVVEGLVNTGNVSAVMRTAEAMGCQRFHVVTSGEATYKQSERTSRGAEKWLDLWPWERPEACAAHLKARGYRIAALHLAEHAVPIEGLDFTGKTALVFGNERDGVSGAMQAAADVCCVIPLAGFTESFNVSVAAALALYHARRDRQARSGRHADLTPAEQEMLRARFYLRSVRRAEVIIRHKLNEA